MELIDDTVSASREYPNFDIFLEAYFQRLSGKIADAVKIQSEFREQRRLYGRKPFQSIFTRDCLSRGRDRWTNESGAKDR